MTKQISKTFYFFFTSLVILILHLPFVFAVPASEHKSNKNLSDNTFPKDKNINVHFYAETYSRLGLNAMGLSEKVFNYAMKGYDELKSQGRMFNQHIISIADFTKSSSQKRLFVLDLDNFKILFNTYVAHGQGSGQEYAKQFSNLPESLQSSLGFYLTSDPYIGKHGYSMHLNGLESGINDKANERAIVLHGAQYVSEEYIKCRGFIGRSWGCPAVPEKLTKPIIEKIKNGSCLFIYSDNQNYLSHSKLLNS